MDNNHNLHNNVSYVSMQIYVIMACMDQLIDSLEQYLHEALRISVKSHPWKNQRSIPIYLLDKYYFYVIYILGQSNLLMISRVDRDIAPGVVLKHLEQIQKSWDGPIIYVQSTIFYYNRKRLIEQHIPFIVPGNQMYLPHSGIDLREYFRKVHSKKNKAFSPSTQAAVIYRLLSDSNEKLTPSMLAKRLGYALMTMTRAFHELQAAGIGEFHREGKERYWFFPDKQILWEQAKPFLCSPIKKRTWLKCHPFKTLAGLSALSHFSQLAPPLLPIFAIGVNQWESLKQSNIAELPSSDDASLELEIWKYDPETFAQDGCVDPFSLYLSLETNGDERIELALEQMLYKLNS